jgi:hypothetical protein
VELYAYQPLIESYGPARTSSGQQRICVLDSMIPNIEPALGSPGSNPGSQTYYPDGGFRSLTQFLHSFFTVSWGIKQQRALVSQPPRSDRTNRYEQKRQEMGRRGGGVSSRRSGYVSFIRRNYTGPAQCSLTRVFKEQICLFALHSRFCEPLRGGGVTASWR